MAELTSDKTYHIAMGPVVEQKIPPGDPYWREFNGAFRNCQLTQLDIATHIYDGHAITTCCDPQWRKAENYHLGQHLGLDFDTEDKRSTFAHLMADPFVKKYASMLYTTPSHTPDKPRARVLFLLDEPIHQAQNYALAASSLLHLFGTADRQCKDPVRFFYGCRWPTGEIELLHNELPLGLVKNLVQDYQEAEAVRRSSRPKSKRLGNHDSTDEGRIRDALDHLNPWAIDYSEWVSVLMALHSELGQAGLSLAESWAAGYPGEVEQKWRGFDASGNASGRVTIGTLFALAREQGWQG